MGTSLIDEQPPMRRYGEHPPLDPREVRALPNGGIQYARGELPDLGTVDAKAQRYTRTRVLIGGENAEHWRESAWVPAGWIQRITCEESSWQDPYDGVF
ncbi:hypothetical protein [Nesterenkonia muleiensis]|uniref:hypothetical protein n=1 Tax=Nesterenkonia muleiensis TaxID=2282648 RepID=UPI0013003A8A|nr:hypothetical protein [Nesterenkonia muleiensis]